MNYRGVSNVIYGPWDQVARSRATMLRSGLRVYFLPFKDERTQIALIFHGGLLVEKVGCYGASYLAGQALLINGAAKLDDAMTVRLLVGTEGLAYLFGMRRGSLFLSSTWNELAKAFLSGEILPEAILKAKELLRKRRPCEEEACFQFFLSQRFFQKGPFSRYPLSLDFPPDEAEDISLETLQIFADRIRVLGNMSLIVGGMDDGRILDKIAESRFGEVTSELFFFERLPRIDDMPHIIGDALWAASSDKRDALEWYFAVLEKGGIYIAEFIINYMSYTLDKYCGTWLQGSVDSNRYPGVRVVKVNVAPRICMTFEQADDLLCYVCQEMLDADNLTGFLDELQRKALSYRNRLNEAMNEAMHDVACLDHITSDTETIEIIRNISVTDVKMVLDELFCGNILRVYRLRGFVG